MTRSVWSTEPSSITITSSPGRIAARAEDIARQTTWARLYVAMITDARKFCSLDSNACIRLKLRRRLLLWIVWVRPILAPQTKTSPRLSAFPGNLAEHAQNISAEEFTNPFLGVAPLKHCVRNHRQVSHIAHVFGPRRPAIEVRSQRHVILAHELDRAVDNGHPVGHRELQLFRHVVPGHRELAPGDLIDVEDGQRGFPVRNAVGVPEGLSRVLRAPLE